MKRILIENNKNLKNILQVHYKYCIVYNINSLDYL